MLLRDKEQCAEQIIERVGKKLIVATPLGLGKPVQLLNALYRRAQDDSSIELTILTALTFCKPSVENGLASRLYHPILQRIYGDYEDLRLELDRRAQRLPNNVRVIEFFLTAGAYLDNAVAQRNVVVSNFTHAARDILALGPNVLALMVAIGHQGSDRLSLSSNVDLTNDLMRCAPGIMLVGQINKNLPYMYGDQAEIRADRFELLLSDGDCDKKLFSIPRRGVGIKEYLIGMYVSSLVRDDGCLQIGIGSLSDAVAQCLILRHRHNEMYREVLDGLGVEAADIGPFAIGLFASTEMLTDAYLELYRNEILKKVVKDRTGSHVAHAGFFVGSNAFYQALRDMPKEILESFSMRSIMEINQLYGDEDNRRAQRKNARFINSCIKAGCLGEIISDSAKSGATVSGVGGQYNFVAMAHELIDARSIIMCKSTRSRQGQIESNIVFSSPHATIPRHLRDIVVTEYGIADLRGKTDEEVIAAMLNIADSRFQDNLLDEARKVKKISANYRIPDRYKGNLPEIGIAKLKDQRYGAWFKEYPFGSELDDEEICLARVLKNMKKASLIGQAKALVKCLGRKADTDEKALLKRMALDQPRTVTEHWYSALMLGGMRLTRGLLSGFTKV